MEGRKINYSEELKKCKAKTDMAALLNHLDVSNINSLESRVLRQFSSITDEEEKRRYAENVIIANNLPICIEFRRIIVNGYSKQQYIKFSRNYSKCKNKAVYDFYQMFLTYSKTLQEKNVFFSVKRFLTNSKEISY